MTMKFVKQNFMGIELDVLVGHPEHDLLFVATQVARVAGLKDPSVAVRDHRKTKHGSTHGRMLQTLMGELPISRPEDHLGRCLRSNTVMFTESEVYAMLLRSRAPQTEPFRKWVTEEVLPSIRKTGTYNIHESETKEAQQFAGEFAQLHSAISELTSEVLSLKEIIAGLQKTSLVAAPEEAVKSPYEGQPAAAVCDPAGFNKSLYNELTSSVLDQLAAERMLRRVIIEMDIKLGRIWAQEDGRPLKVFVSAGQRRKWNLFPQKWLQDHMNRKFYQDTIRSVLSEKAVS
jgi:prophage antirepressor-like protein